MPITRGCFARFTKPERLAFLVNAYNAFTLQAVLLAYPLDGVDSLRDVGGKGSGKAWKERTLRIGRLLPSHEGGLVSLDDLRGALRTLFEDARVCTAVLASSCSIQCVTSNSPGTFRCWSRCTISCPSMN